MEARFGQLSIKTGSEGTAKSHQDKKKGKAPVAESWEDESLSSEEGDSEYEESSRTTTIPNAPPPTPISPSFSGTSDWDMKGTVPYGTHHEDDSSPRRRPEKQTAVAGRLIAGALGVRAPKKTEEQRAYDKAVKEQEIKKRNREREEAAKRREDAEKAKAAAWGG